MSRGILGQTRGFPSYRVDSEGIRRYVVDRGPQEKWLDFPCSLPSRGRGTPDWDLWGKIPVFYGVSGTGSPAPTVTPLHDLGRSDQRGPPPVSTRWVVVCL